MRFTIYGKNMHVSEGLKETLKKKFEKFDRYFEKETEVFATFSKENNNQIKNNQMLEVTIPVGKTILRAEERSEDMVTSIENAVNKLEGQLRKHKTKLESGFDRMPTRPGWRAEGRAPRESDRKKPSANTHYSLAA